MPSIPGGLLGAARGGYRTGKDAVFGSSDTKKYYTNYKAAEKALSDQKTIIDSLRRVAPGGSPAITAQEAMYARLEENYKKEEALWNESKGLFGGKEKGKGRFGDTISRWESRDAAEAEENLSKDIVWHIP